MAEDIKEKWLLPMNGAYNMRDLGGFKNAFGKYTRYEKMFRSEELSALTQEDLDYLGRLSLSTVIDFRTTLEIESAADKLPQSVSEHVNLPISAGNFNNMDIRQLDLSSLKNPEEAMKSIYRDIIRNAQPLLKTFFQLISNNTDAPTLFHCTAGKDRTGVASALFLSALNVDRADIMLDYMRSKNCLKGKYDAIIQKYPVLGPVLTVEEEYLQTAFNVIEDEYNGVNNYLVNHLDVDIDLLHRFYTA
ncbi:MAG TPA: protein-tyrosine-phosphatase [Porphyromonadaceae bacterium]|nr:protein-tyrosine-phosphatase [Porphyromonadaceae bacterium]